jgi:chemotaxis signal transduction protein
MRPTPPAKHATARTEQIILFRVSGQLFAVSSSSVKEVRAADSLTTSALEVSHPSLGKVKQVVRRGGKPLFIVSGALHFGLPPAPAALVFVLRNTQTALLIDGIEKMTTMTRLQALPQAFCHEERQWYRGLTALNQSVVPVVAPEGFLTPEEIEILDASLTLEEEPQDESTGEAGWTQ